MCKIKKNKIGVAVVGASARSGMVLRYSQKHPDEVSITGIYDIVQDRARYLMKQYGQTDAACYASLDEAVSDPRVDAVFIGTSDYAHAEPACVALGAEKHVYCEKPLTVTIEDCDRIIKVAKTSSAVFYLGMNLRHGPIHERVHTLITSGKLGKVLTIEANEYYYEGRTYFRRWNRLRKYGGGLWVTKACHDFDLLNWMAGGRPTRVFASSNLSYYRPREDAGRQCRDCPIRRKCPDRYNIESPPNKVADELARLTEEQTGKSRDLCLYNSNKDTFDNGIAIVEYDNDVRATYTLNVVSSRSTRQMSVLGTKGAVEADMGKGTVALYERHSGKVIEEDLTEQMKSGHGGADDRIMADFFHCCRTGRSPRSSWEEGRVGLTVSLAARKSCDTGQSVRIPLFGVSGADQNSLSGS